MRKGAWPRGWLSIGITMMMVSSESVTILFIVVWFYWFNAAKVMQKKHTDKGGIPNCQYVFPNMNGHGLRVQVGEEAVKGFVGIAVGVVEQGDEL